MQSIQEVAGATRVHNLLQKSASSTRSQGAKSACNLESISSMREIRYLRQIVCPNVYRMEVSQYLSLVGFAINTPAESLHSFLVSCSVRCLKCSHRSKHCLQVLMQHSVLHLSGRKPEPRVCWSNFRRRPPGKSGVLAILFWYELTVDFVPQT